jgi:DNA helicase-2/ATP-dependent DNA helicase PcrA
MKAVFTTVKSQQDQAKKIVAYIKTMKKKGVPYKEMAVLYRNNFLSRNIEKALMENQIKYKIYGGIPFFNRAEVQDVLSYLKLLVNPYDFQAFKRSVACPKRGIGEKALDTIENYCRDNNLNIRTAIAKDDIGLKPKAKKALKEYVEVIEHLENLSMQLEPHEMIQQVLLCTGYYAWFQEQYKNDNLQEREENLTELVSVAKEYINIDELVTQASLYKEELEEEEDAVQLLTMHKSKGLEFKCVFIIDLAEGCMPSFRATSVQDIEEERRLMFVAVTRAKDYLFMMYPQNQKVGGQNKYVQISRFIKEIDSDLLTRF